MIEQTKSYKQYFLHNQGEDWMYHSIMYLYILFFQNIQIYYIRIYSIIFYIIIFWDCGVYSFRQKKKANLNMYGILARTINVWFILKVSFFKDGGSILEENSLHHHSKANTTLCNICVLLSAHLESLACPNGPTCLCPCIFCPTSCRPMAWHVAPSTANPL